MKVAIRVVREDGQIVVYIEPPGGLRTGIMVREGETYTFTPGLFPELYGVLNEVGITDTPEQRAALRNGGAK